MNRKNIILSLILIAGVLGGWSLVLSGMIRAGFSLNSAMREADRLAEKQLYAKSLAEYEEILQNHESEEVRTKYLLAYEGAYRDGEAAWPAYEAVLRESILLYPENTAYIRILAECYQARKKTESAYGLITEAFERGVRDERLREIYLKSRYQTALKGTAFSEFRESPDGSFTVRRGEKWGRYLPDTSAAVSPSCSYLGPLYNGINIEISDDCCRIRTAGGITQGIIAERVISVLPYSSGLSPAETEEGWYYYSVSAEKVFGPFLFASAVSEHRSAVLDDAGWHVFDTDAGEMVRNYKEIRVDNQGFFSRRGWYLAKEQDSYHIYQADGAVTADFAADEIDEYCGSWVAYCRDGLWGFADVSGEIMIEPKYQAAKSFRNGLAAVRIGSLWGFINQDDELVIPCQYYDTGYFNEAGVCPVDLCTEDEQETEVHTASWRFLVLQLGIREDRLW